MIAVARAVKIKANKSKLNEFSSKNVLEENCESNDVIAKHVEYDKPPLGLWLFNFFVGS
jgi:hypothetical protein